MSNEYLPFEKPLIELKKRIDEIKKFANKEDMDVERELVTLEEKAALLEKEVYKNLTPWERVQIARHKQRPTTLYYIKNIFSDFIELHGDRFFGDDPAIVGGLAILEGIPVTVLGHEKGFDLKDKIERNFGLPHPEGYRKALRLMRQAAKFQRPIITFIDTQGAYPGIEAEKRGQSQAIAQNLIEMAKFKVPIISVVIGEGGSGGALAIGVCNRLLMLENAYYSVISPEGAAAILWKDANYAAEAAKALHLTAYDLKKLGIVDAIIAEPRGGAHKDPKSQALKVKEALVHHLQELLEIDSQRLVCLRTSKFREIGKFGVINC